MEGKISKYPKFEELMEMLGSVVNEDCISIDAAEDLNEVNHPFSLCYLHIYTNLSTFNVQSCL